MAPTRTSEESEEASITRKELLAAMRALKRGDFSVRLPEEVPGVDGQICQTFNAVGDLAQDLVKEAAVLRKRVGREGRTGLRLSANGGRGGWATYVSSVNEMLDDLTGQAAEVARVVTAVGRGDLTQRIDLEGEREPLKGNFLQHARAVNGMVEQLEAFGSEVTRVARQVGVEGKLGAQADVPGVAGSWRELTESVNDMATNLTSQVREIARVTTAVAQGDLTQTVDIEARGEIHELKKTINTMVDQLGSFADEVTRVAREVGTEGRLGGQAQVKGVSGTWRELTENVNSMAANLTNQVRNIAEVATSIADGDLSKKITVDARGEILELKKTINTMVDQLNAFSGEVIRVAREVGAEGELGGQAEVEGVSGVWRELTENVNSMAANLTNQVRAIADVVTAIAMGDLSKKIAVDAKGEIFALKSTINDTVDKLGHFSEEVTRVARLVGTEGTLGVQAEVKGVSGIWKELTDNVNQMGRNLTDQVRDIAEVTTAVANGDLSRKITVEVRGEILELKNTINAMVDSLSAFADEVTRMARDVGTEGVLGGQADVRDVSGIWQELTDNVNSMAANLTNQVRNISEVATAVAHGDLGKKITVDARGEVLDLKNTINAMVEQLTAFADEVTRVAHEVGVEGKLGGQAEVEGVQGVWKELTNNVNLMATNLTDQVRDIAEVTTAVAQGDLTRKITVEAQGEILELKSTINTMVDQLNAFADEVTRLAVEVGVEGKLGGQADVRGVLGTWRELTDAVNSMATNLTDQVRSISKVSTAIAEGDLRKKITVEAQGEILELKNTINTMVDQLNAFADEVTRVAREVGVEGKLGGVADVPGASGTWRELTDNVNSMASNLTDQVRDIAVVTTAVAQGDLSRKISVEVRGELLQLKNTVNTMVDQLNAFAEEVTRVAREVGTEGKLGGQAQVRGVSGIWKELTDNVNSMATNLTDQVRDIAGVTTAVAQGDLSRKIAVEVRGELLQLKNTINTMVDQLGSFADEVTRVAREVGTEGMLGGQAQVRGVSGIWKELTDNVNLMATNLTEQVRGIARVVTAVATGDLEQRLQLMAKGEIAALVDTINSMTHTLSTFADEVTRVAREVGVEGKLGGQADVPGAAGMWRDLTDNVNELAGNLTRQVRAIGDVATAVTKGDLTRAIDVEARGEVAELKDNLNQMIETLAETTRANEEQDWLKTNLTRFSRLLQGQRDLLTVADQVLTELAHVVSAQHGVFYMSRREEGDAVLRLFASYAYSERKSLAQRFRPGQGLVGQSALEKKRILVNDVPVDYVSIASGLGESPPRSIVVVPILFEDEVKGVIELASYQPFTRIQLAFLDQLLESLGIVIATIEATMRTDELLRQSQGMAEELQTKQEELQRTNEDLEEKARLLTEQRDEVEAWSREVQLAKEELEEKAEQLALTSKYKSQFLANMSHELRTPLNSMLIFSRQLAENRAGNLDPKQIEYAEIIRQAGADLLDMINEILDLAKIESGTFDISPQEIRFEDLREYVERTFSQVAQEKKLAFSVELDDDLPESLVTDDMRLKQVLRNLLSNAFKFTDDGEIRLRIYCVESWQPSGTATLDQAEKVIGLAVTDTGIGIAKDKQSLVFEAFQQADGGTSRKYGGTGLGLSIVRELVQRLGGEIRLHSDLGEGSNFTLYLPLTYWAPLPDVPAVRHRKSRPPERPASVVVPRVADDRADLSAGDRVVLIVEHDAPLARSLLAAVRRHGFHGVVAATGNEALETTRSWQADAVLLDLVLPDMDGWVLLDRLKHTSETRHVPVVILAEAAAERRGLEQGAMAALAKPVSTEELDRVVSELRNFLERRVRHLLVVEDDERERQALVELIGNGDVEITAVGSAGEALSTLRSRPFDCLVVDMRLPDMSGIELIRNVRDELSMRRLPVVVYTGKELEEDERTELERLAETVILKDVRSPERLLDATALFLHRTEANLAPAQRAVLSGLPQGDSGLAGKQVLVVDDDVRNIFAITAVLEEHGVEVLHAENGREALRSLDENPDVEAMILDIMMPEMDGYEALRRIREQEAWRDLPIIALTAKAMKGDREQCLEAGASDYVTKPVEPDQLVSLLRVWLHR